MSLSDRFYRALLRAYPADFRREFGPHMAQLFRDLCRDARRECGLIGLAMLWVRTLVDLIVTAVEERSLEMRENPRTRMLIAAALLVLPVSFIVVNVLIYELGLALPDPFDALAAWMRPRGLSPVFDALLLLGPVAAVALSALPVLRGVRLQVEESTLAIVIPRRLGAATVALLALGLLVIALFAAYLLVENWPCLVGLQASC